MKYDRSAGWKSVAQLFQGGIGPGRHALKVALEKLREDLIERLQAEGMSAGEALARVEQDFIRRQGQALIASPEAIALLEVADRGRRPPKGWMSGTELAVVEGKRHRAKSFINSIVTLKQDLTADLADQLSIPEVEAAELVKTNLINNFKPSYVNRDISYASPDAARLLRERISHLGRS